MNNNIDWIIHLVANGACDECGKEEKGFLPYTCNAHTHGMEKYDHPDFQVVLSLPPREIGRILNTLGLRVQEDVFMAMQEIPYILKSDHAPESKMLVVEENMARALTLRWGDYDLAKAVSY